MKYLLTVLALMLLSTVAVADGFFVYNNGAFKTLAGVPSNLIPLGVDNAGEVLFVGNGDNQGCDHPTLYSAGALSSVSFPGAAYTCARSISSNGTILGDFRYYGLNYFLDQNGAFTQIASHSGFLLKNNDAGQLIAESTIGGEPSFLYDPQSGTTTPIAFPGASYSYLKGISNDGSVLGGASLSTSVYFLYGAGQYTQLTLPGNCTPTGINDSVVVGSCMDTLVHSEGFIYSQGTLSFIQYPNLNENSTAFFGISDNGQIVGSYWDAPEPASLYELLVGFCVIGGWSLYRKHECDWRMKSNREHSEEFKNFGDSCH